MSEELPDTELLARLGRNDPAALGGLYDRFAPRIFGLLTHILPSRDEAEEILRDVFQRLGSEGRRLADEGGSVAAWLVVTSREAALERFRSQRPSPSPPDAGVKSAGTEKRTERNSRGTKTWASALGPSLAASKPYDPRTQAAKASRPAARTATVVQIPHAWLPRPQEITVIDDRLDLLHKVVNQLPKSQREALEFAVFRGLGEEEIAAELGEPLGKVRTGLRAAVTFVKHRRRAILGTWAANI